MPTTEADRFAARINEITTSLCDGKIDRACAVVRLTLLWTTSLQAYEGFLRQKYTFTPKAKEPTP